MLSLIRMLMEPFPDGTPFLFYQHFWSSLKDIHGYVLRDFHVGTLDIYMLNFAMPILVPKQVDATVMKIQAN